MADKEVVNEESENETVEETVENKEEKEATIEEQLVALEEEVNTWKTDYYKVFADMENLKKRLQNEHANAMKFMMQSFIEELLPVVDNFERSLAVENPSDEIIRYTQEVLNYSALFMIFLGFIFVYRNVLQGMGESFVPMMAGIYELVARSLVVFILPKYIGFAGICLADPIAWIAAALPLMFTYYNKIKKIIPENKEGIAT